MTRMHITMQLNMNSEEIDILAPYFGTKEEAAGMNGTTFYDRKFKCLWLLHGLGGVSGDWMRYSMIEVFAEEKEVFVICPEGRSGYYTDCPQGEDWESLITGTVWDYLHHMFPMMSDRPEDNIVMGNSMGGYGAARFALRHPDKFGYGASLSGGLNVPQRYEEGETINGRLGQCFGPRGQVTGSGYDLYQAMEDLARSGRKKPEMFIACGTQDWEYEPNREFFEALKKYGFQVSWDEGDYGHEWRFWNGQAQKILNRIIPENLVSGKPVRGEADEK